MSALQRLPSRLAPVAEALARIGALVRLVEAREIDVAAATARVLAADIAVTQSLPASGIALRDGRAVRSDVISDAGPYAPVALTPPPAFVEVGALLPPEADAVLPPDALTVRGSIAEATASAVAGDGVLAAGADAAPGQILRRAGERLRAPDAALLRATGVPRVSGRAPRLLIGACTGFI